MTLGNFFIDLSVLTAISIKSGMMRDYDYMLSNSDAQSHYSEHDAWFDKHLEIHPEIGYTFNFGNWSLYPSAGFLLRHRKWSAEDGYVQYPSPGQPWSSSDATQKTNGVVISYVEAIWFPTVSLGVSYRINGRFEAALSGSWYPYLNIETIDSHYIRRTVFYDTMRGGMGFLSELALTYHPVSTNAMNFRAAFGFEGIYPNKGTTSTGSIGYDTGKIAAATQSHMESNLFWLTMGVVIYPELVWKK
jgi:outer membrane protease